MKGKELSLGSKLFAGVFVIILSIMKGTEFINLQMGDILLAGAFFALLFSPVDISIWIDKFTSFRK